MIHPRTQVWPREAQGARSRMAGGVLSSLGSLRYLIEWRSSRARHHAPFACCSEDAPEPKPKVGLATDDCCSPWIFESWCWCWCCFTTSSAITKVPSLARDETVTSSKPPTTACLCSTCWPRNSRSGPGTPRSCCFHSSSDLDICSSMDKASRPAVRTEVASSAPRVSRVSSSSAASLVCASV